MRVVVYRDSGLGGTLSGINLSSDGKILITIANKKFETFLINPGPKEINIALAIPGNPTCTKTIFIAPNQINYLKIGERGDYNKNLATFSPLISLLVENSSEKSSRCGGPWEPYVIKEVDANREINSLR